MKRLLLACLLLFPLLAIAQSNDHVTHLTKDSLSRALVKNWKFFPGDADSLSAVRIDDSKWKVINTELRIGNDTIAKMFANGVGWFRLHFVIDSTMAGLPLALRMTHYGASELYLDGKRIKPFISYGVIKNKDSSIYNDPQTLPFIINIPDAGEHVLAIRYANFDAEEIQKKYNRTVGFRLSIGEANEEVYSHYHHTVALGIIMLVLSSLFVSFSILHFFLYLYNRSIKSNLYFSIFALSLGLCFFIPYLNKIATNPSAQFNSQEVGLFAISATCLSLSGFINELFGNKRLRFRIIAVLCIIPLILWKINVGYGAVAFLVLLAIVVLESIVLTIDAIYKKVKGARIIGTGILFFTLFIFVLLFILVIFGDLSIDEKTISGQVIELIAVAAILSIPVSMSAYLAYNFSAINKDLKEQLSHVKILSQKTIEQEQEKKRFLETRKEELEREVALRTEEVIAQKVKIEVQHDELKAEKKKSDDLLRNILPEEVAEELKQKGTSAAKYFDMVTVMFTDFVDFTKAGEKMTPQELVTELDTCFKMFDDIIAKHNIEKIKTIGDAYLAVSGLPVADIKHAENVVSAATEIVAFMTKRKQELGNETFDIRVGVHSGAVVAGIVGVKKFAYDIWGDTVNTAARMEQNSEAGKINISESTYEILKDKFTFRYRGEIDAKNKGMMKMYFVN